MITFGFPLARIADFSIVEESQKANDALTRKP